MVHNEARPFYFIYNRNDESEMGGLRAKICSLAQLSKSDKWADIVASNDALGYIPRWSHSHSIIKMAEALVIDTAITSYPA